MNERTYKTEFPDFDYNPFDYFPESDGWQDISWKNETCPHLFKERGDLDSTGFSVFCDYADESKRECGSHSKFYVFVMDEHGENIDELGPADTPEQVRAMIQCYEAPKLPEAKTLADEFARNIRRSLTTEQLAEVNRLNATPKYATLRICATHNFIDANMAMADAWETITGREMDASSEDESRVWSDAWDLAVRVQFRPIP
jgi:hypothetical protein